MKIISKMTMALLFITVSSLVSAHQINRDMQQKLMVGGTKYSFNFEDDFGVDTLKNLIQGETKIQVDIDPRVDIKKISSLNLRNVTFLDYLYQGADSLKLEAIQKGKNRIVLVPKK